MPRPTVHLLPLLLCWTAWAACAPAQPAAAGAPAFVRAAALERPLPYPPFESPPFTRAVERGTRTRTGHPGPNYWTQYAEYRIEARLDPATARLTGSSTVRYHNRSPDTLSTIAVHLYQNLHAADALRNREVPLTGGVDLRRVAAGGRALLEVPSGVAIPAGGGYRVDGTVATLRLPFPLVPGAIADLAFDWAITVPGEGAIRMGQDREVFFLGYWYPQVAVYDDISGWHTDPYLGNAEFHMGFADYEVALTVPAGWLVAATGTLQNPDQVLSARTRQRLEQARRSGEVVRVVTADERGAGRATAAAADGTLTWRFSARNVRDFAWGTSDRYVWDATHALTRGSGAASGDTVMIHALYRPGTGEWHQSTVYGRHSVEYLSRSLWPYPWPHMTAVEGLISGGMEYPMITLIGGPADTLALYSVTVHEIAHMWFPMQAASDEKRHAWMDEGVTRFLQAQAMREFFRGYDREAISRDRYLDFARQHREIEMMRHGDLYPPEGRTAYFVANYDKAATVLVALRALLGEDTFERGLREFGRRWTYRHPQPWDFFHTFESVAGRELGWFWRTWFFETWTLDQAIAGVRTNAGETEIMIEDRGLAPMPVRLAITRADGSFERREVPVEIWLAGARRFSVRIAAEPAVTRVEIDPEHAFPDIERANNVWEGQGSGAGDQGSGEEAASYHRVRGCVSCAVRECDSDRRPQESRATRGRHPTGASGLDPKLPLG